MPTNRTKRTRASTALDYWKIDQLLTGQALIAGVGFAAGIPHGCNHWTWDQAQAFRDALENGWRTHGSDLLAWLCGDHERFNAATAPYGGRERFAGQTPWALSQFGEPEQ
jgi:hypothetical protein